MIKSTGNITITMTQEGGNNPDYVSIRLADTNGTPVVRIQVSVEDFTPAILSGRHTGCSFSYFEDAPVGKVCEHKTELVTPLDYVDRSKRDTIGRKALAPFEIFGWVGDTSDLFNPHRRRGDMMSVSFHRFVDPPAEDKADA